MPGALHQLGDALRLGHVSRQRLLAGDALERSLARSRSRATISSTFSMRAWFGPVSQIASIAGSATMSAIDAYGFAAADVERARQFARPTRRSSCSGSRRRARRRRARRERPACESAR